jgi:hypothetical protein
VPKAVISDDLGSPTASGEFFVDLRTPLALRIPLLLFAAGFVGTGIYGTGYSLVARSYLGLGSALMFGTIGYGCWRTATAHFTVQGDAVLIRNYFKTWRLSLHDVERFTAGDAYGIRALLRSGQSVQINAVQKSSWAFWTGARTRADTMVDRLNQILDD